MTMMTTTTAPLVEVQNLSVHYAARGGGWLGRRIRPITAVEDVSFAIFPGESEARGRIAARYDEGLAGAVAATPAVIAGGVSTWAQYTIEHPDRDGLAAHLKALGVPTAAYYPMPMHRQECYAGYPRPGGLPVSEEKAETVLSLPMHAYLDEDTQDRIIDAVRGFNG